MRGQYKTLITPLVLSYFGMTLVAFFFPQARFIGFVGFLTLALSRLDLPFAIWTAAFTGLFIDINSPSTPMGFFALNYALTSLIIFRYRRYFSEDKIHIFTLYSVLFSFVSIVFHFLLQSLVELHLKLHIFTVTTDLILMPIFDGVYAFTFVLGPISAFKYLSKWKIASYYKKIWKMIFKRIKARIPPLRQLKWVKKRLKQPL